MSHHPGGLGGKDWDDPATVEMPDSWDRSLLPAGQWQHPRGWMHGHAHGEIRVDAGDMDVYQAVEGPDDIYPDGPSTDEALAQLDLLAAAEEPFLLAFGILRPHLPFGAPASYLALYDDVEFPPVPHPEKPEGKTTWHKSGEFYKYNRWGRDPNEDEEFSLLCRKHYAACVSYADAQVGRILDRLESHDLTDDTIIVLWGDHGWHLGEHGIWGKHCLFEEALRSPLIIAAPGRAEPGAPTDAIVETVDLFPTLAGLAGLPEPSYAMGESLLPQLDDPASPGHAAYAQSKTNLTVRTDKHRLILHGDGFAELYDHTTPEAETRNVADDNPELVTELTALIDDRLRR